MYKHIIRDTEQIHIYFTPQVALPRRNRKNKRRWDRKRVKDKVMV